MKLIRELDELPSRPIFCAARPGSPAMDRGGTSGSAASRGYPPDRHRKMEVEGVHPNRRRSRNGGFGTPMVFRCMEVVVAVGDPLLSAEVELVPMPAVEIVSIKPPLFSNAVSPSPSPSSSHPRFPQDMLRHDTHMIRLQPTRQICPHPPNETRIGIRTSASTTSFQRLAFILWSSGARVCV